ncbi:MAG: hypothetical protein VXY93_13320, partial [Pseudomonadota bacterium]|nr:hypothetical protein [Pseudomonadota bacterium]
GIVTITGFSGITTINGVASVANDLDVDGHTNLDNVSVAGVSTFGNFIHANLGILVRDDNKSILLGTSDDMRIRHTGSHSEITDEGTGDLRLGSNRTVIGNPTFSETQARFIQNGAVELYHDDIKRFETSSVGVSIPQDLDVDGHTNLDNVSIAGVVTATTFVGNGDFVELDVDGHTNLDNVSIAGVVTATTIKGALEATSASFSSNIDANGNLDVDGHTELDNTNIVGLVTVTNVSSGIGLRLIDSSSKQFAAGGGGGGSPFAGSFTGHDFRIQVGGNQNAIFKYAAGATGNLELGPSSGIG